MLDSDEPLVGNVVATIEAERGKIFPTLAAHNGTPLLVANAAQKVQSVFDVFVAGHCVSLDVGGDSAGTDGSAQDHNQPEEQEAEAKS